MQDTHRHRPHRFQDGSRTGGRPSRVRLFPAEGTRPLHRSRRGHLQSGVSALGRYCRTQSCPVAQQTWQPPAVAGPGAGRQHECAGTARLPRNVGARCTLAHTAPCPARTTPGDLPARSGLRTALAARARLLIGTGPFAPAITMLPALPAWAPARAAMHVPGIGCLAAGPAPKIPCPARAAATRRLCRTSAGVPEQPAGARPLVSSAGQLALSLGLLMAFGGLGGLPCAEQSRWRSRRCTARTTAATGRAVTDRGDISLGQGRPRPRLPRCHRAGHPAAGQTCWCARP